MPFSSRTKHIEVGVDWLSATIPMDRTDIAEIKEKAYAMIRIMSDAGNHIRPMSSLGYVGVSVNGSFVGERDDGLFVRFTGAWADRAFWNVYHPSMHVSRVDLHATVWNPPKGKYTGQTVRRQAEDYNLTLRKNMRRKNKLIQDNLGGYTYYIGSPKSENFARCYDKGAEDKDKRYQHSWRFEVQWHNDSATKIAEGLFRRSETRADAISATVADYFTKRGVSTPWASNDAYALAFSTEQPVSDVQTSLEWLRTQVAPTIRKLSHLGYRSNVIEALGLLSPNHYTLEELTSHE
jgi:DNA relaxase NicK